MAALAQNGVLEWCARGGFVVSGLVHLIIGYIAVRIASGGRNGAADQSGALAELASKPGGTLALWVAVGAFAAMALWRLAETCLGRSTEPKSQGRLMEVFDRATAFSLAMVYFALAFSTYGFARGAGESSSAQNASVSARLMESNVGRVALIAVGLIILAVGGYHVYEGVSKSFLEELKGVSSALVRRLGMIGYVAKGLVIAGAGVLVVVATIYSEPEKATGLDGALKTLGAQPFGAVLLIVAGLGIMTYGVFSFAMARYTKM
nr:DUF1206 domain-containing protein [Smaragdicoccus niigatensis]